MKSTSRFLGVLLSVMLVGALLPPAAFATESVYVQAPGESGESGEGVGVPALDGVDEPEGDTLAPGADTLPASTETEAGPVPEEVQGSETGEAEDDASSDPAETDAAEGDTLGTPANAPEEQELSSLASTSSTNTFDIREGNITISAGTDTGTLKVAYGTALEKDNITSTATITITGGGVQTSNAITVASGVVANITLDDTNINVSAAQYTCAFNMSGATVNLSLQGTNILKSGYACAGLQVPSGSTLTIGGEGSLSATGGSSMGLVLSLGAGIGGGHSQDGGTITINSGLITATGGGGGPGIGGDDYGGTITINGGMVTARGGRYGAGIGAGYGGTGGIITINDGAVTATGNDGAAGIGGGYSGGAGGTITINGGSVTAAGAGGGAGIGGGGRRDPVPVGSSGDITITGGVINAAGNSRAAGIGGNGGTINISGGIVTAAPPSGDYYTTIIGGFNVSVSISGGTIKATAGITGTAISGSSVTVDGVYTYWANTTDTTDISSGTPTATGETFTNDTTTFAPSQGIKFIKLEPYTTANFVTTSLPSGMMGVTYNTTLIVSGSTPFSWALDGDTSLPSGLSLDSSTGVIMGMPTEAGTFNFTVKVTNNLGSATKDYSLTISKAALGGSVTIDNTLPELGDTLTATPSLTSTPDISDTVGLGELSYQWTHDGRPISGATNSTYTVGADDMGTYIAVSVSAANCAGFVASGDTSEKVKGVLFVGNTGTVYGEVTLKSDLEIPAGTTLTIPSGATLTIPSGVTLTNNGTIINEDTFTNSGTLTNSGSIANNGTLTNNPGNSYSGNAPTGGTTIFTITYHFDGGIQEPGTWDSYTYGTGLTLPTAPTKPGYTFAEWYTDSDLSTGSEATFISETEWGNKEFWATWTPETYTIKYNLNGGAQESGTWESYTCGAGLTLPAAPTRQGYTFGGWSDNSSLKGDSVEVITGVDYGNKEYWAKWIATSTTIDLSDVTVVGGQNWTFENGVYTVTGDVTITGATTTNRIVVASDVVADITLDEASIILSYGNALFLDGATVSLTLVGASTLQSGNNRAGLEVPIGSTLTIGGEGSLTAIGGEYAAGIGGDDNFDMPGNDHYYSSGSITINSGTITATGGGEGAAGIGGGWEGAGGVTTINGGTVTATGSPDGAGIGGGWEASGGTVVINGGVVTATGGSGTAGIGDGVRGSGGTLTMDGNAVVVASSVSDTSEKTGGILIVGGTGTVYGTAVAPTGDWQVPAGATLVIEECQAITVASDTTLTNNGTILIKEGAELENSGTIINNGEIITESGATVTNKPGNEYSGAAPTGSGKVTFAIAYHLNGGTQQAGSWDAYAVGTGLALPAAPTRAHYTFAGWYGNVDLSTGGVVEEVAQTDSGNKEFWALWMPIPVFGVRLSNSTLTLDKGASSGLIATVTPADAADTSITWTTSDAAVASVDAGGKVTAVSAGTATITATTTDGGFTGTCVVTVLKVYSILDALPTWRGTGDATVRIDAPFDRFVRLMLDGSEVDPANYSVTQGSTIITLSEAYLKTLSVGTHTFRAEFGHDANTIEGYAYLTLAVQAASTSGAGSAPGVGPTASGGVPATGDSNNHTLPILIPCALLGLVFIFVGARSKNPVRSRRTRS